MYNVPDACFIGFTVKMKEFLSVFVEGRKTIHVIVNCYYYLSLMHSLRREPKAGNTCSPLGKGKNRKNYGKFKI